MHRRIKPKLNFFSSMLFYLEIVPHLSFNLKRYSVFILFSVRIPVEEVRFEPLG